MRMNQTPLILGHRGVPGEAPENTLAGFELAMASGADGIELDVHLSRDGELVVIHDDTLDRTTDGSGPVGAYSLRELKRFNAAARFAGRFQPQPIPTLAEVVEAVGDSAFIDIEIKSGTTQYPGIERKVADFILARGIGARVVVSSFNHHALMELKRIAPEIPVGLLYVAALIGPWSYAERVGADALHPLHYTVCPRMVEKAHERGLQVNPWTVNSEKHIRRMLAAGVDAIITNVPALAVQIARGDSE